MAGTGNSGGPPAGPGRAGASGPPPSFPPLNVGRFSIEREIGRGLNSVVYRAKDPYLDGPVALKVLHEGAEHANVKLRLKQHQREVEILRLLSHPNIVGVHEAGIADGLPYILFPFVNGQTLDKVLAAGALERPDAIEILAKVASAVQHAHDKGLIHRDLKPNNIIIGEDREPYVLDFGLSWRRGEKREVGIQSIVGTAAYMSPEQARGEEENLTPASDIYSLGAILYEILTGRTPFGGDSSWKTLQAVMGSKAQPPRQIHSNINLGAERVVLWCLEKEPHKRYATCAALAEDMRRVAHGQEPQGPSQTGFMRRLFG